jgi:hypothetical protein
MTTVEHRIFRKQSQWSHPGRWEAFLKEIPPIPDTIVRVVSGLLIHPWVAPLRGIAVQIQHSKTKKFALLPRSSTFSCRETTALSPCPEIRPTE